LSTLIILPSNSYAACSIAGYSEYVTSNEKLKLEFLVKDIAYERVDLNTRNGIEFLNCLSKKELRIIRNTYYAREGYIFNSKDLQRFFKGQRWYRPSKAKVVLRGADKALVEKILKVEKQPRSVNKKRDFDEFY
jgi:hypothetical protein